MAQRVRVGSRNQIVVPSEVRKELGIKPGDDLLMAVWDRRIVLFRGPEDYVDAMMGLGREVWEGIDPVEYVRGERGACTSSC